jgi:hypothetical protein
MVCMAPDLQLLWISKLLKLLRMRLLGEAMRRDILCSMGKMRMYLVGSAVEV